MILFAAFLFSMFHTPVLCAQELSSISPHEAIELALSRSDEINYRSIDREIARAKIAIQKRNFLPSLGIDYSQSDSVSYDSADSRIRKATFSVDQLLYDGGQLAYQYRNLKSQLYLSDIETDEIKEQLALQVITICTNLLKNKRILEIQSATREIVLKQITIARQEHRLGMITELDLLEMEAQLGEIDLSLASTRQDEKRYIFQLSRILEIPPDSLPSIRGRINPDYHGFLLVGKNLEKEIERYASLALYQNSDLQKLLIQLENARTTRDQTRRSWIPSINAELELSMSGEELPLSEFGYSLGMVFTFNLPAFPFKTDVSAGKTNPQERSIGNSSSVQLFDNLQGFISGREASLQLAKGYSSYEDRQRNLRFDIEEALTDIDHQMNTISLTQRRMEISRREISILQKEVELGEATRIDLIEEQVSLTQQEAKLIESFVDLYNSEATFLQSCGVRGIAETVKEIIV